MRIALIVALSLAANLVAPTLSVRGGAASAQAAAPWPDAARGRPVPRPAWVLVVPASRDGSGRLVVWDRDDPWTRLWRVPLILGDLRVVTLMGDSEDRRVITADAFDGMEIEPIRRVMRKYGAPAIALAVDSGTSAAVAVYVPGNAASWEPVDPGADERATHAEAVRVLAALLSGGRPAGTADAPTTEEGQPAPARPGVRVEAWRPSPDGIGNEFRLAADDGAVAALEALSSIRVIEEGGGTMTVEFDGDPDAFAAALAAAGLSVR